MSAQPELFPSGDDVMSDGTPYNEWQRAVIAEWNRRHPNPLLCTYNGKPFVPWGVYCLDCKAPSVMIVGEAPDYRGYCLCPRCSMPKEAAA